MGNSHILRHSLTKRKLVPLLADNDGNNGKRNQLMHKHKRHSRRTTVRKAAYKSIIVILSAILLILSLLLLLEAHSLEASIAAMGAIISLVTSLEQWRNLP